MSLKIWEVIQYEGDNNMFVWKHPAEDFNTLSKLIVHESQEAVFFSNGQIADVFSAGRYVLHTDNIPVLRRLIQIPTGGESSFHCEVYFVNKVERMALRWGTDSKVQFIEPTYQFPMEIGASGEMALRIQDTAPFLVRLVGREKELTPTGLTRYFRGILNSRVKSCLARTIKEQQLNIFEIDSQLDILSDALKERLKVDFAEYGVELTQFVIDTVVRPEDDLGYRRVKDAAAHRFTDVYEEQTRSQVNLIRQQTEAQMRIMDAQSMAEKRRLEGYTYQDERSFDVAEKVAQNENMGQFSNLGIGLGMMAGIGGVMGGTVSGMVGNAMSGYPNITAPNTRVVDGPASSVPAAGNPAVPGMQMPGAQETPEQKSPVSDSRICRCGAALPAGARFCPNCGEKQPAVCPECGTELIEGARFCLQCGHKLS